jgi:DNA-binding NtrC family response regulator
MKPSVLIVDDEAILCDHLARLFAREGYRATVALSGEDALARLAHQEFPLVLADLRLPEMDGLQLLKEIRTHHPSSAVIVMTAHGTIETAVEAMRGGAADYVTKPFVLDEILLTASRILEHRRLAEEHSELLRELGRRYSFENIISQDPKMRAVFDTVIAVAKTDATVLIEGETGTGKELIARAIHTNSPRKARRFVPVNCAAMPEALLESELFGHERGAFTGAVAQRIGRFEAADGGTLFLDEIATLVPPVQAKLLRVLQEREIERLESHQPIAVDVRVIAATNRSLPEMMTRGQFREDLFYRLNVVRVVLPPLRERGGDIPLLAAHFLKRFGEKLGRQFEGFAPSALRQLLGHSWPGNVRELENAVERAAILAQDNRISELGLAESPPSKAAPATSGAAMAAPLGEWLRRQERDYLIHLLQRAAGNVAQASTLGGVPLKTLYRKLKIHGLSPEDFQVRQM